MAEGALSAWVAPAEQTPPGFESPVCTATLRPQLLLGAPQFWSFAMMVLFAIGFLKRLWPLLPLAVVLQLIAVWGTAQEQHWFQKIWRASRYATYYKP